MTYYKKQEQDSIVPTKTTDSSNKKSRGKRDVTFKTELKSAEGITKHAII
jgi:hypothetical protein